MSKAIAIIGTRYPDCGTAVLCRKIATAFRNLGFDLITGNAAGIDSIARDVWNETVPERVTLVLPWSGYNMAQIYPKNRVVIFNGQPEWAASVDKHHPASWHLTPAARALHARNCGILEQADVVVAFPRDGKEAGGTGQGIRIARTMGKELFVLPGDLTKLREFYVWSRQKSEEGG